MKTFLEFINEEISNDRLYTILKTNVGNKIAGINRTVDFEAGDPTKLNYPKTSVGQLVAPAKSAKPAKQPDPVGQLVVPKRKIDPTTGNPNQLKYPKSSVGQLVSPKRTPDPTTGNPNQLNYPKTSVGQLVSTKRKTDAVNADMKLAWDKASRFPGEGPALYKKPILQKAKSIEGKREIEARTAKYAPPAPPKSVPVYYDSPEKLKQGAEQTWKMKQREPKDDLDKMYAGGYVSNRLDISSPKENLKSYIKRIKKEQDKFYLPNKSELKDWDLNAALGYDTAKNKKTGLVDIKPETNPRLYGSFDPKNGLLRVRKDSEGKGTTRHEYGHRGSEHYASLFPDKKLSYDAEENRQREMDSRAKGEPHRQVKDAKNWWKKLERGESPTDNSRQFAPRSSSDTPTSEFDIDSRHVNPMGFTYPRTEKQVKRDQIYKGFDDRDRISTQNVNDRLNDFARKTLRDKYFRGGREASSDDDLKRAALGSPLPYANQNLANDGPSSVYGSTKDVKFKKDNAITRKMAVDKNMKDYRSLGHLSTALNVFDRGLNLNLPNSRIPEYETGNPDQLKFPSGKK